MNRLFRLVMLSVLAWAAPALAEEQPPAPADAATLTPPDLLRAYQELLARQQALEARVAAQEARSQRRDTELKKLQFGLGPSGFYFGVPADGFQLRIRGVVQADGRAYLDDAQHQADTFLIRRARLYIEGTVGDFLDYRLMPDFGGGQTVLQEAWVNVRPWAWLQLRAGKIKTPFSLERLQAEQNIVFIERSLTSDLAPDRDVGVVLHGDVADGAFSYDAGVLDGAPDGANTDLDSNFGKDYVARVFAQPWKASKNRFVSGLGVGFAGSYGKQKGTAANTGLAPYRTPGQINFFSYLVDPKAVSTVVASGDRWRLDPQLHWYVGPVGLLAEYVRTTTGVSNGSKRGSYTHHAWAVEVSFLLTLESASFTGVTPKKPFSIKQRHFGAFELAARVHELRIDENVFPDFADPSKSARRAFAWGVQLNWYLTRNVRFEASYERTTFDGGAAKGSDRQPEDALLGRLQVAF